MTTTKHTPEPWQTDSSLMGWRVLACDDRTTIVANVTGAVSNPTAEADAARIVACVNALAGVVDPVAELARLRAGDAELAALRARVEALEGALRPFAEAADHYRISETPKVPPTIVGHYFVTTEELRIARATLNNRSDK